MNNIALASAAAALVAGASVGGVLLGHSSSRNLASENATPVPNTVPFPTPDVAPTLMPYDPTPAPTVAAPVSQQRVAATRPVAQVAQVAQVATPTAITGIHFSSGPSRTCATNQNVYTAGAAWEVTGSPGIVDVYVSWRPGPQDSRLGDTRNPGTDGATFTASYPAFTVEGLTRLSVSLTVNVKVRATGQMLTLHSAPIAGC